MIFIEYILEIDACFVGLGQTVSFPNCNGKVYISVQNDVRDFDHLDLCVGHTGDI